MLALSLIGSPEAAVGLLGAFVSLAGGVFPRASQKSIG